MLDSGGHTWLERRFLRLVREAGISRPRPQVITRWGGRFVARVDFSFDSLPVVVEVSGRLGHTLEPERRRDARRRNERQALGYYVIEFTTTDVVTNPAYVLAELARYIPR
jgi:very-short-patch-repair endonuclease